MFICSFMPPNILGFLPHNFWLVLAQIYASLQSHMHKNA